MKTYQTLNAGLLACGLMVATGAFPVRASDQPAARIKSVTGTVTAVDSKDKVLKIRGFLSSKSFVLGEDCTLAQPGRKQVSLADFRPGQKVDVSYSDVEGVLVAGHITQRQLVYSGKVSSVDQTRHTLIVKAGMGSRTFALPDDLVISSPGNSHAGMNDLALGSRVDVTYETPASHWTARRIELASQQYLGTLDGINTEVRTITAGKRLIGDKTFHLADDCTIINNGKMDGHMKDLRLGQDYQLSYTTVNGVNIVNCISPAPEAHASETAQRGAETTPSLPAY